MRFLTADYLYPLHSFPIKEGVLQISDSGEVMAIFNKRSQVQSKKLEIYNGILCPGFVNTHCHLELSHLTETIPRKTGLTSFIKNITQFRKTNNKCKSTAILNAHNNMIKNGIVGVGDIANTSDSFFVKDQEDIIYHTFIELFSLNALLADQVFKSGKGLIEQCPGAKSITPHATYSVSNNLYSKITKFNKNTPLTIHNQESKSENDLFSKGSGKLYDFISSFGKINITGKTALVSALLNFPKHTPIILVHNIYTNKEDVKWALEHRYNIHYCTCPKANLFIEGKLPDYSIFDLERLCVGTDSLASNDNLSILEELQVIKEHTNFDINTLLKIGCRNGAEALQMKSLGTFETGKKPGVLLIKDFEKLKVIC
mgnify:CR=1 FL=1